MQSRLPSAACIILAAAGPAAVHAQATKPLPPGIYFLWTPPGPRTSYDGQTPPNINWVAEQSGRSTAYGIPTPAAMDAATEVNRAGRSGTDHPMAHSFLDQMWFRLAPATPGSRAPDLHLAGRDYVTAGQPVTLWLSNETVTTDDPMFVSVRVDAAPAPANGAEPAYATTTGAVAPGRYGSSVQIGIPALPAGTYLVSIEAREAATGLHRTSTRTLIVQ